MLTESSELSRCWPRWDTQKARLPTAHCARATHATWIQLWQSFAQLHGHRRIIRLESVVVCFSCIDAPPKQLAQQQPRRAATTEPTASTEVTPRRALLHYPLTIVPGNNFNFPSFEI
eukprot:2399512-Amphidinium_carterae.1